MGGSPLDKVRVEVTLTIDCNGVYGAKASVVGQSTFQQAPATEIKRQRVTLTAPHPDTYKAATDATTVTPVSRHELQSHAGDIIDGTVNPQED